jgi:hypothetical protein
MASVMNAGGVAAPVKLPWRWRVAASVVTAAGVVVFAVVVAHWGWRAFGPTEPPAASSTIPENAAAAVIATPLFGRAGLPVAAAPNAPTPAQGDARLLGVFAESGGVGYALFRLPERGPILVAAGGKIADDVTLTEVRPNGVRIRDHGEIRDLELRTVPTATRAAPPRVAARANCAPPPGYVGPVYRLNAELLAGVASQPESWKALLVPVAGGLAVRDDSGFGAMLGMKTGDRMMQANGIALSGVDDVLVAFVNPLIASQSVRVTGIRSGKPADWLFVNAGACPG